MNIHDLVARLGSTEDGVRKKAAFNLQSRIGDPSFADVFIAEGGLNNLLSLALNANGNTLAYSLTSLSKLLEVDKGWDHVNQTLVERVRIAPKETKLRMLGTLLRKELSRLSSSLSTTRSSTSFAAPCPFW